MQYARLGNTGLKVSRICLGCMTYGTPKWRDWVLDEEASRPFIRRALEAGINFFDTADMYSDGASEEVTRPRAEGLGAAATSVVIATKVFNPMGPGPTSAGCRASTSCTPSTPRCGGSGSTTSTSTRSTASTRRRRSRRRWRRCTTS